MEWAHGPLMVLAGAGTGKTTVVVERVRHLLDRDPTLQPENILVLTYNVRAAGGAASNASSSDWASSGRGGSGSTTSTASATGCCASTGPRPAWPTVPTCSTPSASGCCSATSGRSSRHFLYHRLATNPNATLGRFADMISRAKDELVTPQRVPAIRDGGTDGVPDAPWRRGVRCGGRGHRGAPANGPHVAAHRDPSASSRERGRRQGRRSRRTP